jgi:HSP20 family protein
LHKRRTSSFDAMHMKEIAMMGSIRFNGVPHIRWNPAVNVDRALHSLASEVLAATTDAGSTAQFAANRSELRADVRETATAYVLQLDVPGVAKEDITVDVDEKAVRIEADVKRAITEGETALLSERASGPLVRVFRLAQAVDAEQASAHHEHGVLTLTLPKRHATTQRRLAIN